MTTTKNTKTITIAYWNMSDDELFDAKQDAWSDTLNGIDHDNRKSVNDVRRIVNEINRRRVLGVWSKN